MKIVRTRVQNVDRYVHPGLKDQFVRVMADPEAVTADRLKRMGLGAPLADGELFLPAPIGRFTRFNAEGKWTLRRDLPKEERYIRTVYWTWRQFTGGGRTEEVSDSKDIFRKCYQREFTPPPSEEIFGFPINGKTIPVTEAVSYPAETDRLRHQINLMLELFGTCEVVRADGTSALPAMTSRRWVFLPSGPFKTGDVTQSIQPAISRLNKGDQTIISGRQEYLTSLDPKEIAQGLGGFSDYLAYVYPQYGRVVLESLRRDNAIYVFKGKWERFSKLTKREILDRGVHDARIVHSKGWESRLRQSLKS